MVVFILREVMNRFYFSEIWSLSITWPKLTVTMFQRNVIFSPSNCSTIMMVIFTASKCAVMQNAGSNFQID